jgi:hypothetical protein
MIMPVKRQAYALLVSIAVGLLVAAAGLSFSATTGHDRYLVAAFFLGITLLSCRIGGQPPFGRRRP